MLDTLEEEDKQFVSIMDVVLDLCNTFVTGYLLALHEISLEY